MLKATVKPINHSASQFFFQRFQEILIMSQAFTNFQLPHLMVKFPAWQYIAVPIFNSAVYSLLSEVVFAICIPNAVDTAIVAATVSC